MTIVLRWLSFSPAVQCVKFESGGWKVWSNTAICSLCVRRCSADDGASRSPSVRWPRQSGHPGAWYQEGLLQEVSLWAVSSRVKVMVATLWSPQEAKEPEICSRKEKKSAYTYTSYAFEIYYVFPRRKGWELTFKPTLLKKKCNLGLKCLYKCHHNMIYTHFYIMYLYILIVWSQKWSNQCHCHTHPLK